MRKGSTELKILRAIQTWIRENPHAWWALYLPVYLILFVLVEHAVDGSGAYWVPYLPIDDQLPFLEGFVLAYCTWYPMLFLIGLYLLFADGPAFRRYMQFIAIGFTLGTLICFLIPNGQNLRPQTFAHDNLLTRLVQGIYRADTNTNVFPSVHVIGCFAAVFAAFDAASLKKLRAPLVVLTVLISLSTLFIKQHSVLDMIGAVALCVPIWIFLRRVRSKCEKDIQKADPPAEAPDRAE